MVVDHTAWGFVEFMSPLGQIMHIFGRFTVPIMCFFIAEGYRHTSNIGKYISRMMTFAVISIIPFYLFFHEEYDYRQNIIFDLTLALLALCAMEKKSWPKPLRTAAVAALIAVSMLIGGWVIMPIVYVLVFYYGRDFKDKAKKFCFFTILMEVVLIAAILLNQRYHFSGYDWTVQERLYLLGFMIALIPLSRYNGEKGTQVGGRYFFYIFYPAHFMVLFGIKYLICNFTWQNVYVLSHVVALGIALIILFYVIIQPVSRAQMAVTFFMTVGVMYIYGFLLEITTNEVEGVYTATKLQYFAEGLVMLSITLCVQELCHTRIPSFVYAIEAVVSSFTVYSLFTYRQNGYMYREITMNTTAGPFPRMEITDYGIAFYLFVATFFAVCVLIIAIGVYSAKTADEIQKKRLRLLLYAMISMWAAYVIKPLDLTRGYEIPALFIPISATFLALALAKYSYLDSISFNFSNAVDRGREGMLIIDRNHRVLYNNDYVHTIFGNFSRYHDAYRLPHAREAFEGSITKLELPSGTYELRVEPLMEQGHHTGDILWIFDMTEHYEYLSKVEEYSMHDDLTGLLTRQAFEDEVCGILDAGLTGAFYMVDVDRFKHVNDTYGHQIGDEVLIALSDALRSVAEKLPEGTIVMGRLGGDEFCFFYRDTTERKWLSVFAEGLIEAFDSKLAAIGHPDITSVSIGIAVVTEPFDSAHTIPYTAVYKQADKALYEAKGAGRRTYRFF